MDFCHFLAEWTAYIIIPIIIIGTNIWVDVMGVSTVHTTEQIHENAPKIVQKRSENEVISIPSFMT